MKNIFYSIVIVICTFSCTAQTVVPLSIPSSDIPETNYYRKDLNNVLDKYVGTWTYTNGNTSFTVVLIKRLKVKITDYYTDQITGWYKYVENGVIKVNTLPMNHNKHLIFGSKLSTDGNRILLFFNDPARPKMSVRLRMNYTVNSALGTQPELSWKLTHTGTSFILEGQPEPLTDFRVPTSVTLIKQ
ncbi:DUF6705 family protein [uncultured Kordia sp.]|uniref:DUF6705 family protein n=1 Tax=uncultured Kordia sp. TaxID=507699 RepID=UPI002617B584|nr:DUF6705 family protein [uncultured Kordia sp.]